MFLILFCVAARLDASEPLPVKNIKESLKTRVLGGDWSFTFLLDVTKIAQPPPEFRARQVSPSNVTKLIESIQVNGVDYSLAGTVVVFEENFQKDFFVRFRDIDPCDAKVDSLDWSAFYAAKPVVVEGSHRLAAMQKLSQNSTHRQAYSQFTFRILILKNKTTEIVNNLIRLGVLVNQVDQVRSEMTDIDMIFSMHEKLMLKYTMDDPTGSFPLRVYLQYGVSATEQELMKNLFGFRNIKGNAFSHLFQLARWKGDLWEAFQRAIEGPPRLSKPKHWSPLINCKGLYDSISTPSLTDAMRITILKCISNDELSWKQVKIKANSLISTAGLQTMIASFFNMSFTEASLLFPNVTNTGFLNQHLGSFQYAENNERNEATKNSRKVRPVGQWKIPSVLLQELKKEQLPQIAVSFLCLTSLLFDFCLVCFLFFSHSTFFTETGA
jgi:hypothetical protein